MLLLIAFYEYMNVLKMIDTFNPTIIYFKHYSFIITTCFNPKGSSPGEKIQKY